LDNRCDCLGCPCRNGSVQTQGLRAAARSRMDASGRMGPVAENRTPQPDAAAQRFERQAFRRRVRYSCSSSERVNSFYPTGTFGDGGAATASVRASTPVQAVAQLVRGLRLQPCRRTPYPSASPFPDGSSLHESLGIRQLRTGPNMPAGYRALRVTECPARAVLRRLADGPASPAPLVAGCVPPPVVIALSRPTKDGHPDAAGSGWPVTAPESRRPPSR